MKFIIALSFFLLTLIPGIRGQTLAVDPDTIMGIDGQYFMPYSGGVIEKSLTIAPGIARMKPSQVNLIRKKLSLCSTLFSGDSLMRTMTGLKAVFREEILPEQGLSESVRWIPSSCSISLFTTLAKEKQPYWDTIPDAWLTVHLNNPKNLVGNPVINDVFLEPVLTDSVSGWTEFDRISVPERIMVAKKSPVAWFEPVSRDDFILTLIAFFQGSIDKSEKRPALPRYVTVEPAVKREQELQKFNADLEKIRKYDPGLADRLMQLYLETGNNDSGEQGDKVDNTIVLNSWKEAVRKLKAEMNAMSPQERKSQAWWSDTEDSNVSGLTPAGFSGSRPLVRLNKNLIDKTKPGSSIQLIVMECSMLPGSEFADTEGYNLAYDKLSRLWNSEQLRQLIFNLLDK